MRKLVVSNIVSLDGYVAGPDGDSTVLPMDDAFDAYNVERLRAAGTLLVGANSYAGFSSFWPAVLRDPDSVVDAITAQLGDAVSREEVAARITGGTPQQVARLNDAIDKVVVSDRLGPDDLGAWRDRTEIVRRSAAHARIAELKAAGGAEILVFGSRTLWTDLLAAGLVDELHLMVGPVVLGAGVRAFDGPPPGTLELLETRRFDGSGNVLLRYAVRG